MTILRVNEVSSPSGAGVSSGRAVVTGVILVIGVLVAVFPAFAGYGYWAHGEIGVAAAAVAAVVCLVGGLAGWAAMIPFRGPQAVNGVLLGMLVRQGLVQPTRTGELIAWAFDAESWVTYGCSAPERAEKC